MTTAETEHMPIYLWTLFEYCRLGCTNAVTCGNTRMFFTVVENMHVILQPYVSDMTGAIRPPGERFQTLLRLAGNVPPVWTVLFALQP